jgi:DNA-binding response OmpR family regulator
MFDVGARWLVFAHVAGQAIPRRVLRFDARSTLRGWLATCVRRAPVSVLIVQPDGAEARALVAVLDEAGFHVSIESAVDQVTLTDDVFDVVVIGAGARLEDQAGLCRRLRSEGYLGAIIALSVSAPEVPGLVDAGADDFVVAPIQPLELVARVRMALRRVVTRARSRWGPLEVDRFHRKASLQGKELSLTAREYALLACLLAAGGELVPRAELLAKVWGRDEDPGSNLVEVHLSRLRDKLGEAAAMIETVRRAGYRLRK